MLQGQQSAMMLIDSFMPEGITQLAVDSIFMMPQLGVLANIDKEEFKEDAKDASLEVFEKDCLIRLGTCIAPVGRWINQHLWAMLSSVFQMEKNKLLIY